jgi:hypothetical protein
MTENNDDVFWVESKNLILPCTNNVPEAFTKRFLPVLSDVFDNDRHPDNPIGISVNEHTIYRIVDNIKDMNIIIGYISKDLPSSTLNIFFPSVMILFNIISAQKSVMPLSVQL